MLTIKQRNRLLNIAMVVLVAIIVVAGALFVLDMRGMLPSDEGAAVFTTADKTGNVNIQREGVSYRLDEQTPLRANDQVQTLSGSFITLQSGDKGNATLDEKTQTTVRDDGLQLDAGGVFGTVPAGQTLACQTAQVSFGVGAATVVVTAQTGSTQVFVLDGSVDAGGITISRGEGAIFADGSEKPAVQKRFDASALDDFMLSQVTAADKQGANLYLSGKDAKEELAKRKKAQKTASNASGSVETDKAKQKADADKEQATDYGKDGSSGQGAGAQSGADSGEENGSTSASAEASAQRSSGGEAEGTRATKGDSSGASSKEKTQAKKAAKAAKKKASNVTVEIRCDTILKHKKSLAAGKSKYVPANGVVLPRTKVRIADGDTAFDVLKAACDAEHIQLEYRYTPVYATNYIEGINNLYEKDCGDQSGWIYRVNGWEPNVGCSQYQVKNGDVIVWAYTCEGYGKDVA